MNLPAVSLTCLTCTLYIRSCLQRTCSSYVAAPRPSPHADTAGANASANGTDSTTRLMSQLAEGASAAADVAAALPPSTRASASSLVQSAVKLASSFSPAAGGRQQASAPVKGYQASCFEEPRSYVEGQSMS